MNQLTETAATIGLAIIGVAILAVIVSRQSNTTGVIGALGQAFSGALQVAVSPVTGASMNSYTGYQNSFGDYFSGGLGR